MHKRMEEHKDKVRNRNQKNAMAKHMEACHSDVPNPEEHIAAQAIVVHSNVLKRVVDEALRLENDPSLANGKSEWGRGGGLVRLHSQRTNQPTPRDTG